MKFVETFLCDSLSTLSATIHFRVLFVHPPGTFFWPLPGGILKHTGRYVHATKGLPCVCVFLELHTQHTEQAKKSLKL